jgi:hypothetical protein
MTKAKIYPVFPSRAMDIFEKASLPFPENEDSKADTPVDAGAGADESAGVGADATFATFATFALGTALLLLNPEKTFREFVAMFYNTTTKKSNIS